MLFRAGPFLPEGMSILVLSFMPSVWKAFFMSDTYLFLYIGIRYNSHGREFRSVRHFQSEVFVLVDDDGHAFDIWEYTRDGPASPSCMTASTSSSLGTQVVHWCAGIVAGG